MDSQVSDQQQATASNQPETNGSTVAETSVLPHQASTPTAFQPPVAQAKIAATDSGISSHEVGARDGDLGDNIVVRQPSDVNGSANARGRGGLNRGKARARSSLSTTKPRKRKRKGGDDDDEGETSDEVCTPTAVTTKSGRNVQRPTTFVPPTAASPNGTANGAAEFANGTARVFKKKRVWRRNADNAVCKACLRGTSPASNMIVFCDGCNTPYHRWCHHPPISQKVIEETDVEWYCRGCSRERVVPVPESELAHWLAAPGASKDERKQFFLSLTPGTMVTLLLRAATIHPDLPIYAPEWLAKATHRASGNTVPVAAPEVAPTPAPASGDRQPATIYVQHDDDDGDVEGYGPAEHPAHYVRPGKGLMSTLPPDKDDDKHLVDEESSRGVFHHVYLVGNGIDNTGETGKP